MRFRRTRESVTDAVSMVEHGGDAIETEAIEPKFGHEIVQIRQEEPENLGLVIVEQAAVP